MRAPRGSAIQRTGHLSEATEAAGPEAAHQPTPVTLDLCAPSSGGSKDITTTDRSGAEGEDPGDYQTDVGATSSATPLVADVAALVLAANRDLSSAEVKDVLCSTADKLGDQSFYDANGHSTASLGQ